MTATITQQQAQRRITRAEEAFRQAIAQIEAFWARHGQTGSPLLQQSLEREYKRRQRALRAARTAYCTLANQHGWSLPGAPTAGAAGE